MKKRRLFALGSLFIGVLSGIFVLSYSFFYPKQYIINEKGDHIKVSSGMIETFPVSKNTAFEIEYYYPDSGKRLIENVDCIPLLLGCDKQGVIDYLNNYMKNISYEEKEKGLSAYEMISYSDNHIYLRKTFRNQKFKGYYAKSYNGTVVILNGDGKTVYDYTQITIDKLPEDIQKEVLEGYPLENEQDLYNFLENYSS